MAALLIAGTAAFAWTAAPAHGESAEYGGEKYQDELLAGARSVSRLQPEPSPEGKVIERIVTVPYEVILAQDPYPGFLNWFHITTVPEVIERELLFSPGQAWSAEAVRESAHNLLNHLFLGVAQIVPCKGSAPSKVVALVVTKDLWSLRSNMEFLYSDARLELLDFEVTEENLLGRMKRAAVGFGFNLFDDHLGLTYKDPRVAGSLVDTSVHGDLIWNRNTGKLEGEIADFTVEQPLYTLDTKWAWIAATHYRNDVYRLSSGGVLYQYVSPTTQETIPYVINRHTLNLQAGVVRSFGHDQKKDFSGGYKAVVRMYSVPGAPVQAASLADFQSHVLPLSESAGMLYAAFHSYRGPYSGIIDVQSFALTEEYRLGLDFTAEARFASPAFGFSSTYVQPLLTATWTLLQSDDLFTVTADADIRYQPQLTGASPWANGAASFGIKNVSPKFHSLRLHTGFKTGRYYNDYDHNVTTLGGDNYLRGYPTGYLIGANYWVANAELRTLPISMYNVYVGLAAFADMGAASDDLSQLGPHASIGAGVRIGLPQFNKDIIRIDFGLPLESVPGGASYFVGQFGQVF